MADYIKTLNDALQLTFHERELLISELMKTQLGLRDKQAPFITDKTSNAYDEECLKTPEIGEILTDPDNSL